MRMFSLAVQNFKSSFRSYVSLILSLAFTILVLYNFSSLLNSGILNQLGETNARNIEICIQVLSFVIGCFMFFFIWYSTNVFLTKRKKEIGIYAFMGLSNQKNRKIVYDRNNVDWMCFFIAWYYFWYFNFTAVCDDLDGYIQYSYRYSFFHLLKLCTFYFSYFSCDVYDFCREGLYQYC